MRFLILSSPKWSVVEDAPRLGDVDRRVGLGLPRQLDQPFEVGAHHRVLAGGVGHALAAASAPCARPFPPPRASARRRSPCSSSSISAAASSPSPSSFWIVRICSRSRCLRLTSPIDSRVRSATSRDTFSTSMRCASSSSSLVEPRLEVEGFEQRLLFLGGDVEHAGDDVGELRRGSSIPCSAAAISAGTCGSSCSVSSARCFSARARPSISESDGLAGLRRTARARPGTDSLRGTAATRKRRRPAARPHGGCRRAR